MIPKKDPDTGEILGWMPIKLTDKTHVTFVWNGKKWDVKDDSAPAGKRRWL